MKNLIFFFCFSAIMMSSSSLFAQKSVGDRGNGKAAKMEQVKVALNLTDNQITQLKAIHKTFKPEYKQIKEIRNEREKKAKLQQLRQKRRAEMEKILTPTQIAKYKELRKERKGSDSDK